MRDTLSHWYVSKYMYTDELTHPGTVNRWLMFVQKSLGLRALLNQDCMLRAVRWAGEREAAGVAVEAVMRGRGDTRYHQRESDLGGKTEAERVYGNFTL